jgi:hypothetical protein
MSDVYSNSKPIFNNLLILNTVIFYQSLFDDYLLWTSNKQGGKRV